MLTDQRELTSVLYIQYTYVSVDCFQLGHTPLHQAAQQGHVLVIKLLLQHHANPDTLTTVSH